MRLLVLALLLLGFTATPALAQDEEPVDDDGTQQVEPTPDVCDGDGADAQYVDCREPCPEGADDDYGADGDYAYCVPLSSGGGEPPERDPAPPAAAVRPAALQTLPLTGSEIGLTALFGVAFLLAGSGLRLLVRQSL